MELSLLVGVDHVFFEPFDPFDVIDRVTVLDVHWSLVYELEVFGHLPRSSSSTSLARASPLLLNLLN